MRLAIIFIYSITDLMLEETAYEVSWDLFIRKTQSVLPGSGVLTVTETCGCALEAGEAKFGKHCPHQAE